MSNRNATVRLFLTSLIWALLLMGCQPGGPGSRQQMTDPVAELRQSAASLFAAGEFERAAATYRQLQQLDPDSSGRWQLREADAWLQANNYLAADELLTRFTSSNLGPEQAAYWQLLRAEYAFAVGDFEIAKRFAESLQDPLIQEPGLFTSSQTERLQRLLQQLAGADDLQAQRLLDQLAAANDSEQRREWFFQLASLPGETLQTSRTQTTQPTQRDWLYAADQARRAAISNRFELLVEADQTGDTEKTDSRQPVSLTQQRVITEFANQTRMPARIAVLLPESDNLKGASDAIRKGMVAAWLQLPEQQRPQLHFIDSGSTPEGAIGAYFTASDLNADWIIGPLQRQSVDAIRDLEARTIPVLLLNQPTSEAVDDAIETQADGYLDHYVFALPPEDDAIASARQARTSGHQQMVIIAPEGRTGERLSAAFANEFERLGGRIMQQQNYQSGEVQLTDFLAASLNLNASVARHQRLQTALGQELAFRQRSNVDAIFMAGSASDARVIMPQLKFIDLDYVPVYATGRVQSGINETGARRDLDRIHFTTSSWLLGEGPQPSITAIKAADQGLQTPLTQGLFGLGRDSLLLLPYLQMLRGEKGYQLNAASGHLRVSDNGLVTRDLQTVQLRNGRLRLTR